MNEESARPVVHDEIVAPGAPWSAPPAAGPGAAHRRPRGRAGRRLPVLRRGRSARALLRAQHDQEERHASPDRGPCALLGPGTSALHDRGRFLRPSRTPSPAAAAPPATPCSTAWKVCRAAARNFLAALAEHGLGWTDIVPNVNFFSAVPVYEGGRLAERTFVSGPSGPGDRVDLRAERDVLAIVSNCPQVNNPAAGGRPTPIRVRIFEGSDSRNPGSTPTDVPASG